MAVDQAAGFWSYTREDNRQDGQRIVQLADRIKNEYSLLTGGGELQLFLDRDMEWGAAWRERIESALVGATFLIPIVTPRFFTSAECRKEVIRFRSAARNAGLDELLLPVYYVTVPELETSEDPSDEVMAFVKSRNWVDWRSLRLTEPDSAEFRRVVNTLAERLATETERFSETEPRPRPPVPAASPGRPSGQEPPPPPAPPPSETVDRPPEDVPGQDSPPVEPPLPPVEPPGMEAPEDESPLGELEELARGEQAAERMGGYVETLAQETQRVAELAQKADREVQAKDARGAGFAGRVSTLNNLAKQLTPHADRIQTVGQEYASALVEMDPFVLRLFRAIEEGEADPEDAEMFFQAMRELASEAVPAIDALRGLTRRLDEAATLSRSMRPPVKRMKAGLQGVIDGESVLREWARRAGADEVEEEQQTGEDDRGGGSQGEGDETPDDDGHSA